MKVSSSTQIVRNLQDYLISKGKRSILMIVPDVWMQAEQSWTHQNKWVMTLSLAATRAKHMDWKCEGVCVLPSVPGWGLVFIH